MALVCGGALHTHVIFLGHKAYVIKITYKPKARHYYGCMAKTEKNFIKITSNDGLLNSSLFLTFIGASVYFVNQVDGFWNIVLALLKAAVWPAILIYNVLQSFTA